METKELLNAHIGLPNPSLRLFELDAPSVNVHWLSYRDEFLIILPITLILSLFIFFIGNRYLSQKSSEKYLERRTPLRTKVGLVAAVIAIIVVSIIVFQYTDLEGHQNHFFTQSIRGRHAPLHSTCFLSVLHLPGHN